MAILLKPDDVRNQSLSVWGQFGEQIWIPNSKINSQLPHEDINELKHSGIGKFAVLCAMGSSLESNIDTLIKHREKFDVICCDKAFGPLLDHGVKADYVVLADASIPFSYIKDHIDKTDNVSLLATPYANTEWTKAWKGKRYFYINLDAIDTQNYFLPMFGNKIRVIPASSNVSNAMVVLWTNTDNKKNENWGGYEQYYLIGYDYSWPKDGNYYAWNDVKPKRYYMNNRTLPDITGKTCFTSENLLFSCKWLISYISTFDLPVVNCSMRGILDIPKMSSLDLISKTIFVNKNKTNLVKNIYNTWKSSYEAYKKAEHNFQASKEVFLWQ